MLVQKSKCYCGRLFCSTQCVWISVKKKRRRTLLDFFLDVTFFGKFINYFSFQPKFWQSFCSFSIIVLHYESKLLIGFDNIPSNFPIMWNTWQKNRLCFVLLSSIIHVKINNSTTDYLAIYNFTPRNEGKTGVWNLIYSRFSELDESVHAAIHRHLRNFKNFPKIGNCNGSVSELSFLANLWIESIFSAVNIKLHKNVT